MISDWQDYGLYGLIIGALFYIIWYVNRSKETIAKAHIQHSASQAERHANERKEWLHEHREERRDWKEDTTRLEAEASRREDRLERVIQELTHVVRERKNEYRPETRGHVDPES